MRSEIRTNQKHKIPIIELVGEKYSFRYGFERSADSILTDTEGQDYIAINYDDTHMTFALCDGVSQSFFGDIASSFLGNALVDWLWNNRGMIDNDISNFENHLSNFLDRLTEKARRQVQQFQLPTGLALMLPEVLEKKRALGSETTFIAGYIDFNSHRIILAWMGDSRLRLWESNKELSSTLLGNENFLTKERWSTHRGRIGNLHTSIVSTKQLDRCLLYSDGLAKLDRIADKAIPGSRTLEQLIEDSRHYAGSDDISYLEVYFGAKPVWDKPLPKAPLQFRAQSDPEKEMIRTTWRPIKPASYYELAVITSKGWQVYETEKSEFSFNYKNLIENSISFCVRAWVNGESSPWSRLEKIDLQSKEKDIPFYLPPPVPPLRPSYGSPQQHPNINYSQNIRYPSMVKQREPEFKSILSLVLPILLFALLVVLFFSTGGEKKYSPARLTSLASKGTLIITETSTPTASLTPTITPSKTPTPKVKSRDRVNDRNLKNNKNEGLKFWQWLFDIFLNEPTSYTRTPLNMSVKNFYYISILNYLSEEKIDQILVGNY